MTSSAPESAGGPRLELYVAGESARSLRATQNLGQLVASVFGGRCDVEVIDVVEAPERAERKRILAAPTLLKEFPWPRRRISGDLSDLETVVRIVAPELSPDARRAG